MKLRLVFFILAIYIVGLIPRLYQLSSTGIYPDEITWMVKGKETIYALGKLNLNYFKTAWWNDSKDTYAIGWPLVITNGISHVLFAGAGKHSLHFFSDLTASRLPLVFLGPLTAVALFIFARKYINDKIAFVTALLYTLNPITIALDRWLLHDSYLTLFCFMGVITYINAYDKRKLSLLPAAFAILAFLTKPQGVIVLVSWISLLFLNKSRYSLKLFSLNLAGFFVFSFIWPQTWFDPLSIPHYLLNQLKLANVGDPIPNYFFGPTSNPHWSYYFFQLATRLPEIILVLFLFSILNLKKKIKSSLILPALTFCLVYLFAISAVSVKGGIRYALPLFPWIYLVAGYSLQRVRNKLILTAIIATLVIPSLYYHPDYYLYHNLIIGGPSGAQRYDLVGTCIGSKAALEYLDKKQINGLTGIIGCYNTGPYNTGRPLTSNWNAAELLILESHYSQQYPRRPEVLGLQNRQLIHTIIQKGVVTAQIYR